MKTLKLSRVSLQGHERNEMGNIESTAKIDVAQLRGLRSRELNISRSLGYEEYKEVSVKSSFLDV